MRESRRGERLFRAWSEEVAPFDQAAGRARFLEAYPGRRQGRRWTMVLAAAAAFAFAGIVIAVGVLHAPSTLTFATTTGAGQTGEWLATGTTSELPLLFSEGTRVVMAPDSRGRVEQLGRAGATFLLERGEVRAHVFHQAATSWQFRAGPFEVQVTGTALGVEWDPARERFAVQVDEGAVVVHGPAVGSQQVVRAGERCVVDLPSRTMRLFPREVEHVAKDGSTDAGRAPSASSEPALANATSASSATSAMKPTGSLPSSPSWTSLEERGEEDAAYAAAQRAGLASVLRSSSADELLRLAQVGQLTGHRDTEREALLACRRRFPSTEDAAVAAYKLGRGSSPGEAATWFDAYVREQPTGPLAREAFGRLIEARVSAGDDTGAREAASRYLARYPDGPHAGLATRLLAGARD